MLFTKVADRARVTDQVSRFYTARANTTRDRNPRHYLQTSGCPGLVRKVAKDMPEPPHAEEPDELLEKATTMLSYCKSILGEKAGQEHFVLVAAAINVFGDKNAEEAARFVKENWDLLDERAGVVREDVD